MEEGERWRTERWNERKKERRGKLQTDVNRGECKYCEDC